MNRRIIRLRSPYFTFGILALLGTSFLAYYFYRWNTGLLLAYLLGVNIATLFLYAYDKLIAGRSFPRVPEIVLQGLAIAGGSPAALAAQKMLRHKTVKKSFQRVYWIIVILQVVGFIWYFAG